MFQDDPPPNSNHHEPILLDPKQLTFPFAREDRDFRSPRDIAVDIVEKIFADAGEDWNEDMNGARPIIRITTHREHVSPIGKERRKIAPLSAPKPPPARNLIRTQVADLRNDDGKIDFDEIRNRAKPKPIDVPEDYSLGRRVALLVLGILALGVAGAAPGLWEASSGPPAFLGGIIRKATELEKATAGPGHRPRNSPSGREDTNGVRP